jgi:hypothetical protein
MAKMPNSHYRPKLTTRSSPVHRYYASLDSSLPVPQGTNMESVHSGPLSVCAVSSQKPVHVHWNPNLVQDPLLIRDLEATLEFTWGMFGIPHHSQPQLWEESYRQLNAVVMDFISFYSYS